MSERPARARLFVALDLPSEVRAALGQWGAEAVRGRDGLRVLDAGTLHVTLCFLGWREEAEAEAIWAAVAPCAGPAPVLGGGDPAWLPPRRPRVLAVDLEDRDGEAGALQRRVSDALVGAAGHEPERRPFRPHVTVARVRGAARVRAFDLQPPEVLPFRGTALTLYRSYPGRGGARYHAVASSAL